MNKLECSVHSCRHNSDNLCCLPGISVEGPAARDKSQTCCASFEERTGSAENSLGGVPASDTSIECKAEHCAYNDHCRCAAESVTVGCTCGSPDCRSDTECCTFKCGC